MKSNQGKKRNSRRPLLRLAERVYGKVLAITPKKMDEIMAFLGPRFSYDPTVVPFAYDDDDYEDTGDDGYTVSSGIATIPISGTLVKRASGMNAMSGLASYEALAGEIGKAMADPDVKGIVFDVDSPGGEVDGMFDLAEFIYSQRGTKPMYACCNDQMCSAAYALGSCADQIYVTSTGMTGSIGCFMLHRNQAEADKMNGVEYTYVFSGDHKVDGNPHEALSAAAKATMQTETDRIRDMFVALVARNRNATAESIINTQAAVFPPLAAIPLLADKIGSYKQACDDLMTKLGITAEAAADVDDQEDDEEDDPFKDLFGSAEENAKLNHHGIATDGSQGAPDIEACHAGIEILAARIDIDSGKRFAAWKHLAAHIKEAGGEAAELSNSAELPIAYDNALRSGSSGWADYQYGPVRSKALFDQDSVALAVRSNKELRASAGDSDRKISMLVVPYEGAGANLGSFREVYQRGCFSQGLDNDPRALFNHDEACVIGRTSAGTCRFWEDAEGVHVDADAPATTWADDLLVSMRRGDITQASAAFWILKERWEMRGSEKTRVIEKARMREASVHSFAAYENTMATVAKPAIEVPSQPAMHAVTELDLAQLEILQLQ